MITQKYLDELTYEIIGSATEVHKIMGRGFFGKCISSMFERRVYT
jgi:hypothetical protein